MSAPIIQGTAEWFSQRVGKPTASRIKDINAKTKTGYAASRAKYMGEQIAERLTGKVLDGFQSAEMKWGTETEPMARSAVEAHLDVMIEETGMVDHPTITSGASPDGLIDDDGVVEIKCPTTVTHIDTLLSGEVPEQYIPQIQWQLACTGRKYAIFASFDPRLPSDLQLFIKRVERDEKLIAEYEAEVIKFLSEVADKVDQLLALRRS